jgi:hypothetical protein
VARIKFNTCCLLLTFGDFSTQPLLPVSSPFFRVRFFVLLEKTHFHETLYMCFALEQDEVRDAWMGSSGTVG